MNKIGDLCANMGKYKDRQTGEEKNSWKNCGALWQRDDGSQVVKMDMIPVGFSGWLSVFEPREAGNRPQAPSNTRPAAPQQRSSALPPVPVNHGDFADDDIPF